MEFSVGSSPSPDVTLRRYDPTLFPKFNIVFDSSKESRLPRFLVHPAEEAECAVVMENYSEKDVTALQYDWVIRGLDGKDSKYKDSTDSYLVDVYRPVLSQGDRLLICRSACIHESLLDHVLNGGGAVSGGVGDRSSLSEVRSIELQMNMLLFSDGELAGPDTEHFAAELRCRKRAAQFIAKQIRAAESEHRDVTPVLLALKELPHLREDFLAGWTQRYASQYLTRMRDERMRIGMLQHLENRPTLPKFYRRDNGVH